VCLIYVVARYDNNFFPQLLAAVFFSVYEFMKHTLPFTTHLAPLNHMVSASIAEVGACLIRVPTEVIKTRMQASSYGTLGKSSLSAAKLVLSQDGWLGFYRGIASTVIREVRPNTRNQSFKVKSLSLCRFRLRLCNSPSTNC
jgi:hypothetical protein